MGVSFNERGTASESGGVRSPAAVPGSPLASVVITTKNRRDELRGAVESALSQSVPAEVLVMDDGSTDGSSEMMRNEYPSVRLESSDRSFGLIVQRNRAARLAAAGIIFSIDDDAFFTSPYTVEQTLAEFDDPRVGAVAIPFTEPRKSPVVHQRSPSAGRIFVTDTFIGTAHALRRDLFLSLGGYRESLVHQGEESDFCLRMLEAGYVVRLGSADLIHHMESPLRDRRRMIFYGRRNDVLFAWHNVPLPDFPVHLVGTTFNAVRSAVGPRRLRRVLGGTAAGYADIVRLWDKRQPVPREIYRLQRSLKKRGPRALEEIAHALPQVRRGEAVFEEE